MSDHDESHEPVCGESYDHDLMLIDEADDGSAAYECRRCGAEVFSEPGDEEGAEQ